MLNWLWRGIREEKDREERKAKVKQNQPHTLQLIAGECHEPIPAFCVSLAPSGSPDTL